MTTEHALIAFGTFLVTLAGMVILGVGHWRQQALLLKYAGGDSFYEAMVTPGGASG